MNKNVFRWCRKDEGDVLALAYVILALFYIKNNG